MCCLYLWIDRPWLIIVIRLKGNVVTKSCFAVTDPWRGQNAIHRLETTEDWIAATADKRLWRFSVQPLQWKIRSFKKSTKFKLLSNWCWTLSPREYLFLSQQVWISGVLGYALGYWHMLIILAVLASCHTPWCVETGVDNVTELAADRLLWRGLIPYAPLWLWCMLMMMMI